MLYQNLTSLNNLINLACALLRSGLYYFLSFIHRSSHRFFDSISLLIYLSLLFSSKRFSSSLTKLWYLLIWRDFTSHYRSTFLFRRTPHDHLFLLTNVNEFNWTASRNLSFLAHFCLSFKFAAASRLSRWPQGCRFHASTVSYVKSN